MIYSTSPTSPAGIVLDLENYYIYWGKGAANGIGRANLDGSSPTTLLNVAYPYGVCLDPAAGKIYYSAASYIGRADIDGSNAESLVAADPDAIAIGTYSYTISGTLFEDANFDGTAAAYGSGEKLLPNVDVELYTSNNVYLPSTITDGSGAYHFDGLVNGATYKVRVRTATIGDSDTPPAAGFNSGFTSAGAEVTWARGSALYGGQSPTTDDTATGDNAGPDDAYVSVTINSADITGVNFGVAYNMIVNTNNNGPEIELNGAGTGYVSGVTLHLNSDGSTVQDMVINRFGAEGIYIYDSNGDTIQGNYIGLHVAGLIDRGNGEQGINLEGASNNTIGGTNAGDANYIGGNALTGILLYPASNNNRIQGNYIGVGTDLVTALGNGDAGICIPESNNNLIGGTTTAAAANIIAYNPDGIHTSDTSDNNAFLHNSIYANTDLGIDHNEDGVTANDAGDSDSGPNGLLNFPVINSATVSAGTITVNCELDAPAGFYRIEFFTNSAADGTGYGEGKTFVSYTNITHPGSGAYSFTDSFSGSTGDIISAAATECIDGATCATFGSTSEFSAIRITVNVPNISIAESVSVISDPLNGTTNPIMIPGAVIEYTMTITNQGTGAVDADSLDLTAPLNSNTALYVNDLGGPGSGPVTFTDGSPVSGLTYAYTSLSGTTDDIAFSNDNGSSFTYTPVPDGDGYDSDITHLRLIPKSIFNASGGTNHPNFSIVFRIKVE